MIRRIGNFIKFLTTTQQSVSGSRMRTEACPVTISNPPLSIHLRSLVCLCPGCGVPRQLVTDQRQFKEPSAPSQAGLWL